LRWPKKREFMAFYLLSSSYAGKVESELVLRSKLRDDLCTTMRTSKRILKRLIAFGMLERVEKGKLRVLSVEEYLSQVFSKFREERCRKYIRRKDRSSALEEA